MIYTLLINSVAVYLTAKLLDGVEIKGFFSAIIVAILLALINTFIKPVIVLLTLPVTILTLGLFILVINAFILMLVDGLSAGLRIRSFGWALLFSIVLSIINGFLFWIF
ncbi:phage holin family protein [Halalkalibaculum sp. DA3122]|uniref:phage holin family protein n=1 Tax=unclassified Halalkalibaculum TaxID=2964617 RepID=UPI0037545B26